MKATIYDIAREAGVSIATVSKVINSKGKISLEKRNEIMEIMNRLNYQPSVIASALTGKHTYTIGLLIPDIANPFFAEVARAVEERGHQLGYSVIICGTDNRDERIEQYISVLRQKRVDGIIIGTGIGDPAILRELSASMPTVIIGREALLTASGTGVVQPQAAVGERKQERLARAAEGGARQTDRALTAVNVHTVVADDRQGGRTAADHLLQLGHMRLAVLSESLAISSSRERLRGFRERLAEQGIQMADEYVKQCKYRVEDGKRQATELLAASDRPTALFCCNDLLAVGALQAAKEAGIRVPEDLSVVSFDNTILASVTDPPLTSIAQPMEQLGTAAMDLLVQEFDSPQAEKQRISLRTELIVRESTATAATDG
jgi:DNA-binding LacI/PurR family transcriptional regulator